MLSTLNKERRRLIFAVAMYWYADCDRGWANGGTRLACTEGNTTHTPR
jgi:hypothetical protein